MVGIYIYRPCLFDRELCRWTSRTSTGPEHVTGRSIDPCPHVCTRITALPADCQVSAMLPRARIHRFRRGAPGKSASNGDVFVDYDDTPRSMRDPPPPRLAIRPRPFLAPD